MNSNGFQARVKIYNDFFDTENLKLNPVKNSEGNSEYEGLLRVHWGVYKPIILKQKDDFKIKRHSFSVSLQNSWAEFSANTKFSGIQESEIKENDYRLKSINESSYLIPSARYSEQDTDSPIKYTTVKIKNSRRLNRKKRFSMINGHFYNVDTSIFVPTYGSVSSVWVTSLDRTETVIKLLLEKFKVENSSSEFCICSVKNNGVQRILGESEFPLRERIMLGPVEDEAKLFLMENKKVCAINEEVAQYFNLPEPVLTGFLQKYNDEEKRDVAAIKLKYEKFKVEVAKNLERFNRITTKL